MKIVTPALHALMILAATATLTMAQASMKNACGSNGHMNMKNNHMNMKNACGSNGYMPMKKSGGAAKTQMKNACGS